MKGEEQRRWEEMKSTVCGGGTSSCVCGKQQSEGRQDSVHMHQSVLRRKSIQCRSMWKASESHSNLQKNRQLGSNQMQLQYIDFNMPII